MVENCQKDKIIKIARIYMLKSTKTNKIYIGSTGQQYLCSRIGNHREKYKKYKSGKSNLYYSCFKLFDEGFEDVYIEEVEKFENITKGELHKKEGEYIKNTPNCINKLIAGRTKEESFKINKEKYYAKSNAKTTCECGAIIRYGEKNRHEKTDKHKLYFSKEMQEEKEKKHKEVIEKDKIRRRNYQRKIKDKLNKKAKIKTICECGSEYRKKDHNRHEQSLKHQKYLKAKENKISEQ